MHICENGAKLCASKEVETTHTENSDIQAYHQNLWRILLHLIITEIIDQGHRFMQVLIAEQPEPVLTYDQLWFDIIIIFHVRWWWELLFVSS